MDLADDRTGEQALPVFTCADELKEACKYCAAFGIIHRGVKNVPQLLNEAVPNGTLTFIEFQGLHFAVTCDHVLEIARKRNAEYEPDTFLCATLKDGVYAIPGPFLQPSKSFADVKRPDIAVARIPPTFPERIGKRFFQLLDNSEQRPAPLEFGMAVGFPTFDKATKYDGNSGYTVQMPCVTATALALGSETQFLSTLDAPPRTCHLSGMSGGPVFWSTANHYGLIGFIYEGSETDGGEGLLRGPRVHYSVEPCDYHRFEAWVSELKLRDAVESPIIDLGSNYS